MGRPSTSDGPRAAGEIRHRVLSRSRLGRRHSPGQAFPPTPSASLAATQEPKRSFKRQASGRRSISLETTFSAYNTWPARVGFSGAEGAFRALKRALRLCLSSRPRLERGGRCTTASRQSRSRTLPPPSGGATPNRPIHGRFGPGGRRRCGRGGPRPTARAYARRLPAGWRSWPGEAHRAAVPHASEADLTHCGSGHLPKSPSQPDL
jgi:hypothetical protein